MNESSSNSVSQHLSGGPITCLTFGYVLLVLYAVVATPIVQISRSTGRFDDIVAIEQLVWLIPFVVLIPWLSISATRTTNSKALFFGAVFLLILFVAFTGLMWSQWNRI